MHPYYNSTPSSFYGAGGGRNHACPRARRDPGAQAEPETLVGRPSRTVLRKNDVVESSQLAIEEQSALAKETRMTMHGTMMAMQEERCIAPTAPAYPELQWVSNDFINIIDHNTVLQYSMMACDAYFRLHHRCRPQSMG